jgi:N-acetylated-alpha-linked acidic dipeptidase
MRSVLLTLCLVLSAAATMTAQERPPQLGDQIDREALLDLISRDRLRAHHDLAAGVPHPAGSPADQKLSAQFAGLFRDFGAEVEVHEIWPCLAFPKKASLSLTSPLKLELDLQEKALSEDPDSRHPELGIGWNAYSASGAAEGQVVYANQGRKEDFEELRKLGVDCRGKIVIARYGGNYRGFKWKFAEEAGAIGLVIYTDPADTGWRRGLSWPEGGWANGTSIQRGSILTLPYAGDPLTPGTCASRDARRLDTETVDFPRIPVQPIGWTAAQEILGRMRGEQVPNAWQGGLPFRYRLTGGSELEVRVEVQQERRLAKTFNIVATIPAREKKAPYVVFGSHHDAWTFGAGDPAAGVMTVLEAARVFGAAAKRGWRPEVGLVFALWGAEEHGIIGSTEWVESREAELKERCLAYVNLDMAAMGMNLRASSSPSLKDVLARAAAALPAPRDPKRTLLQTWRARSQDKDDASLPRTGVLGGGSDHVAFLARCGVACAAISAGGSRGSSYHSNYDGLSWYRQIVGDDYRSGELVTRMVVSLAWEFATRPQGVLRPERQGAATGRHLAALRQKARDRELLVDADLLGRFRRVEAQFARFGEEMRRLRESRMEASESEENAAAKARALAQFDRAWLDESGLPTRPWYRNLYAAPDEDSGYAAWMLPALRRAVEKGRAADLAVELNRLEQTLERLTEARKAYEKLLPPAPKTSN